MHGSDLRILTSGNGTWDLDQQSLNFENPMRRDTFMIPAGGYAIMAFPTAAAGAWLLHCHIAWHASEGLVTTAIIKQQDIVVPPQQEAIIQSQCKDWSAYYETRRAYSMVGSGL